MVVSRMGEWRPWNRSYKVGEASLAPCPDVLHMCCSEMCQDSVTKSHQPRPENQQRGRLGRKFMQEHEDLSLIPWTYKRQAWGLHV